MQTQTVHEQPIRLRRVIRRSTNWTLKEHEVVVSHWPDVDAIAKQLPHRTRRAISNFAGTCNLTKQLHAWTGAQDKLLRQRVKDGTSRRAIAQELGLSVRQVEGRMRRSGLRFARRAPTPSGNPLLDALASRAYEINMTQRELAEACGSVEAFKRWRKTGRINTRYIWAAVEALGGRMMPQWDEL